MATEVRVTDPLPVELTYLDDTGGCDLAAGPPAELTCDLPDLAPGGVHEFEIKTRVDDDATAGLPEATTTIENVATVENTP